MTPSILKRRRQDDDDDYDLHDGDDAGSGFATPCPKRRKQVTWSTLDEVRMYVIGEPPSPYLEKPCAPAESMFLRSPATSSPCLKLRLKLGSRGRNASRTADSDSEDDGDGSGALHSDDDDNDDEDDDDNDDELDDDEEEAPVVYNRRRYARGADADEDEDEDDEDEDADNDNDSEDADDHDDDEELYASDDNQSDDASSASSVSEDSASLVGESDDEDLDSDETYAHPHHRHLAPQPIDASEHDASFAEHADADPAAFAQLEHLHHVASFEHHLHHPDAHSWQAPVAHADFSEHADSYHLFATATPVLGGHYADELDSLSADPAREFGHVHHSSSSAAAAATVVEVIVSPDDHDHVADRELSPLDELEHPHVLAADAAPAHLHLDTHFSIDVSGSLPRDDYLAVLDALPLPDAASAPLVVLDASVTVSVSAPVQDDRESLLVPLCDAPPTASADLSAAGSKARLPMVAPLSMASDDAQDLKHASTNLSPSAVAGSPDGSSVVPDSEDLEFQLSPDTLR